MGIYIVGGFVLKEQVEYYTSSFLLLHLFLHVKHDFVQKTYDLKIFILCMSNLQHKL